MGLEQLKTDPCLYLKKENGMLVLRHMDGLVFAGPTSLVEKFALDCKHQLLLEGVCFLRRAGDLSIILGLV
eukprot:5910721-Prorocentrum_lima.AAC.1